MWYDGDKWLGEVINTGGSYGKTSCEELLVRYGTENLYIFRNRFGEEYYISDETIIKNIKELLANEEEYTKLYEYLYGLIIEKFGMGHFLHSVELRVAKERSNGWTIGRQSMQKEIRELLGIEQS